MTGTIPMRLAGGWLLLLGPLVALAPRGMPAWAIGMTLIALAGLARSGKPFSFFHSMAFPNPGRLLAVTAALLALAALSMSWSPSGRAGLTVLEMGYVALGALAVGAWLRGLPAGDAGRLGRLFMTGLAIGIGLYLLEWAFDFPLHRWWDPSLTVAALKASNVPKRTAVLLALLVWPAALLLRRPGTGAWRRHAGLLIPAGYTLASLLLSSRSAMVGGLLALVAYLLALRSPHLVRRFLAAFLALAFAGVLPLVLTLDRLAGLADAPWLFPSARHRVEIWGMAAERALASPLFGHGIDASRSLDPMGALSRFGTLATSLLPLHPHNAFLQIWLELGAAGAALALALTLLLLGRTRQLAELAQPHALALFATALAMASTSYGIWQAWWMCGMLASGLLLALAAHAAGKEQ
ncbi:O-antigen ligase family protein [Azospirillum sp. SYSU D00513]|uniref:O-antigen ligase family protein n=1 Tax=Azospirillum sp. SYSU D00513 TaxID=2812561 RepID=UPI001FFFBE68|nr:O-antigen ligase family protein [Azospirillum sp. SYSU D00513]